MFISLHTTSKINKKQFLKNNIKIFKSCTSFKSFATLYLSAEEIKKITVKKYFALESLKLSIIPTFKR